MQNYWNILAIIALQTMIQKTHIQKYKIIIFFIFPSKMLSQKTNSKIAKIHQIKDKQFTFYSQNKSAEIRG